MDGAIRTVMIRNDQSAGGYKGTGAAIDFADTIDKASFIGIEDLVRGQFETLISQLQTSNFADRIHPFFTVQRTAYGKEDKPSGED